LWYAIRNDCIFDSNRSGYSLNGTTYQSSNTFSGWLQMTIHCMLEIRRYIVTISSSPITINTVPLPPAVPTASATVQPTCATPSGTITITTQSGVEYSVNGTVYQSSNSFQAWLRELYFICQKLADPSCDHVGIYYNY
jgi:hypothetical protein